MRCWCGAKNPYFDPDIYRRGCGGSGILHCMCGGDLCVCHNHGEVECDGCPDCHDHDEESFFDDDDYKPNDAV